MVFGTGRRGSRKKEQEDERRIPYKLLSYEHDLEGRRFKSTKVVYSFWSASKYVLILSIMLWWLPMFGQMIAGYVGGRRAGGPWRGVAASIFPVVALYCVMTGFEQGILPSHVFGVAIAPAAIASALDSSVPFLSPYIHFSSDYVGAFVSALAGASPYGINLYVLTVAFAYVGGVLAEQNRREIEFSSGAVMSNTTVLVHDPALYRDQVYAPVQNHGTFSAVGGFFHLPWRRREPVPAACAPMAHRKLRDSWAAAAEMHFVDGQDSVQVAALPAYDADLEEEEIPVVRVRTRPLPVQQGERGRKQRRRGAPNLTAKPRFSYPQYESRASFDNAGYKGGMIRRNKAVPKYVVSPNPRALKKVQKLIDREWSGGRSKRFRSYSGVDEDYEDVAVEVEPSLPRKHEHHSPSRDWETI